MMDRMTIPIGPQHPLLKEPMAFTVTVEGERVLEAAMRLGYVHRGIEKLAESRTYVQLVHVVERICGICSHVHTTTFCDAVESLMGLEVPPRAYYIRALLCEMERIHSHLLWLGVLAKNVGFDTVFMYSWRDREIVLDIMEELSGGRVSHAVNILGGVRIDLDAAQVQRILERFDALERQVERALEVVEQERTLRARTQGVGILTPDEVRRYCVVGPTARASGVDVDMRRDAPRPPYDELDVNVILHDAGDVWARTVVRAHETRESLRLARILLANLPEGPTSARARRRVPAGEAVARSEAPRGEVFYYVRSDGSDTPARLKVRTPTLTTLATLPRQLEGVALADVPVVLAGVDLCIACADR